MAQLSSAWGSLSSGNLLEHPVVRDVAAEVGRTPGQALLRWGLQDGAMVIPRTSKEERVLENAELCDFTLTADQHQRLSKLHRGRRSYEDPHAFSVGTFAKTRNRRSWRIPPTLQNGTC
eukprot:TRINITY_DN36675_c0_g1_i1.p1 TRINITY_DN36675_c0_g1~~TRINITY_DN36675_c0_g1_i1.p1  ORF type:complete len:119 (+),score=16.89 TRINITY_DN36675_c0_g1_i1:66-422(+)